MVLHQPSDRSRLLVDLGLIVLNRRRTHPALSNGIGQQAGVSRAGLSGLAHWLNQSYGARDGHSQLKDAYRPGLGNSLSQGVLNLRAAMVHYWLGMRGGEAVAESLCRAPVITRADHYSFVENLETNL
jgi:hypothetical protein